MTCWPGSPNTASNSSRPSEFNPSTGIDNYSLADPEARFCDLGPDFHDNLISRERKIRNHVRRLQARGLTVTLTHTEDAA
jgi:hypothetical protein